MSSYKEKGVIRRIMAKGESAEVQGFADPVLGISLITL